MKKSKVIFIAALAAIVGNAIADPETVIIDSGHSQTESGAWTDWSISVTGDTVQGNWQSSGHDINGGGGPLYIVNITGDYSSGNLDLSANSSSPDIPSEWVYDVGSSANEAASNFFENRDDLVNDIYERPENIDLVTDEEWAMIDTLPDEEWLDLLYYIYDLNYWNS